MTHHKNYHRLSRRESRANSGILIGYRIATKESREKLDDWVRKQKAINLIPDDLSIPKSPKLIEVYIEGIGDKYRRIFEAGLKIGRLSASKKELAEFLDAERGKNIDEKLLAPYFNHEEEKVTLGKPELFLPAWNSKERRAARQLIALYKDDEQITSDQRHVLLESKYIAQEMKDANLKTDTTNLYPYFVFGSLNRDFSNVERSAALSAIHIDASDSFPDITFGRLKFGDRRDLSSHIASV